MFSLISAGITAAAAVTSSAIGAASQASTNALNEEQWEKAFAYQQDQNIINRQWDYEKFYSGQAFNQALYNQSVNDNIAQWNRENAFNAPKQQVARLAEAGINPLLAISNGSNVSGNAANMSVANPVSSPSGGSFSSLGAPSVPHYQALNLNGLSSDLSTAFNNLLKSKELEIQKSRTNAQNAVDWSKVKEIKANTEAISDGNIRAQELHTYQLVEAQENGLLLKSQGKNTDALTENIKVRSETMLMNSQKVYTDMLALGIQMEQARFGQSIQKSGLLLHAKEVQAEVAQMSLHELISYSKEFGVLKSGTSSHSETDSNTADGHLELSLGGNISNLAGAASSFVNSYMESRNLPNSSVGRMTKSVGSTISKGASVAKSFFGSLAGGGSYSDTDIDTDTEQTSETYREIRKDTLKPMLAAIRCLEEIIKDPFNVELGKSAERLSKYINTTSTFALKNLLMLQGQIQQISPSVLNPSGVDSYMPQ